MKNKKNYFFFQRLYDTNAALDDTYDDNTEEKQKEEENEDCKSEEKMHTKTLLLDAKLGNAAKKPFKKKEASEHEKVPVDKKVKTESSAVKEKPGKRLYERRASGFNLNAREVQPIKKIKTESQNTQSGEDYPLSNIKDWDPDENLLNPSSTFVRDPETPPTGTSTDASLLSTVTLRGINWYATGIWSPTTILRDWNLSGEQPANMAGWDEQDEQPDIFNEQIDEQHNVDELALLLYDINVFIQEDNK
ncbi:uncharacterized protein LOC132756683 [Ruditapes philippinarum]|uniref:uncharacterized protein LOC132756683 n=1 Tax=Ruditapes philippinarum TaxID=129788 RepID=UPI00295AABC1|nr:uncharacterized protein LOC132756683 [Ruditapes philippinarum]